MQWSREVDEGGVSSRTYPEQEDGIFSDGCVCVSERDGGDREREGGSPGIHRSTNLFCGNGLLKQSLLSSLN